MSQRPTYRHLSEHPRPPTTLILRLNTAAFCPSCGYALHSVAITIVPSDLPLVSFGPNCVAFCTRCYVANPNHTQRLADLTLMPQLSEHCYCQANVAFLCPRPRHFQQRTVADIAHHLDTGRFPDPPIPKHPPPPLQPSLWRTSDDDVARHHNKVSANLDRRHRTNSANVARDPHAPNIDARR